MPLMPRTLAISCGSAMTVVVPWGTTARANSGTLTIALSMCTCPSISPGARGALQVVLPFSLVRAGGRADTGDAVLHQGHVGFDDLVVVEVDDVGIGQQQVGGLEPAGHLNHAREIHAFTFTATAEPS